MEPWGYFSGDKEYACHKSVSASCENGGKKSGLIAFSEAEDKQSSIIVDDNSWNSSSLIDLKLGSTSSDQKETLISLNSFVSNQDPSHSKRSRIPFCQVYGCKKDLRSSKDYHKKHKVCEVHSKTAKVIVDGVEQRFCQQCSRFHILAEFDNGKRSCRRRLAGHNARRRKPRLGVIPTRLGIFRDYYGSGIQGTTPTSPVVLHRQKYEARDWNRPVNIERGPDISPQIDNPVTGEQLHSKSVPIPYTSGKQQFPLHVGENSSALTRGKIDEIGSLSARDHVARSDIGSSWLIMDSWPHFQELPEMPNCGHAPSLLSSQSKDSPHPSHDPLGTSDACYDLSRVSQKLLAVSPTNGASRVSHSHHW